MCVGAEDGQGGREATAACADSEGPMEIGSSDSDEDEDKDNQHQPKKAAVTSRQPKRSPKSPVLDVSSVVSIKQKLKTIMDNLGTLPLVEDKLEVISEQN